MTNNGRSELQVATRSEIGSGSRFSKMKKRVTRKKLRKPFSS
jgi:hypothetical protein